MSTAAHPVSSASDPAPPAEGLNPVTPKASDASKSEGKQQKKEGKKDKKAGGGGSSGPLELNPPPEFFAERIKIFDEYKAKYDKWVSGELARSCPVSSAHSRTTPKPYHCHIA